MHHILKYFLISHGKDGNMHVEQQTLSMPSLFHFPIAMPTVTCHIKPDISISYSLTLYFLQKQSFQIIFSLFNNSLCLFNLMCIADILWKRFLLIFLKMALRPKVKCQKLLGNLNSTLKYGPTMRLPSLIIAQWKLVAYHHGLTKSHW